MATTESNDFDSLFMIPSINETPPTLEEILNDDNDSILEDLVGDLDENTSLSLFELVNSDFDSSNFSLKYSQLNINSLDKIKTQILNAKDEKINSGNPTSLHVSKSNIVIGTFNGHILVFNFEEKLKWFFKNDANFGSVTSLSINHDETKLICGGSKGLIALWNIVTGEMLRVISDVHAPFSSTIHLEFLSDPNYVILSDTSGSVFMLDTRKKDFDSKCIFTGSRGEVLALEPLILKDIQNYPDYSGLEDFCIVGMATISKVLVISTKPNLFVHYTHNLDGNNEFLPFLSWNFEFRHKNRHKPLLAFGRKDFIFITRMVTDFVEKINFVLLYNLKTTNYQFQYVSWFQNKSLLVVDVQENVHLVNVLNEEEVESLDISHVELIYESSNYKSLANGGYVSRAMAKVGEHACTNSFALHHDQIKLYILGLKCLFEVTLRTWKERIEFYNNKNDFVSIYYLLKEYLRTESKDDEILEQFRSTFENFQSFLFVNNFIKITNESNIRKILHLMLNYYFCLHFSHEKLFELFEKFSFKNIMIKNIFIEYLEQYIFDNQIDTLNPILVKHITEYYLTKEWYNLLDSILIHLSITSLDIDHIIKISLKYNMFDSYIYIHNCAFRDFIGPFNDLSTILADRIMDKVQYSNDDVLLGNKLLVYLNCMLTCIYYPNKGRIEDEMQIDHLDNVYQAITQRNNKGEAFKIKILLIYDCAEFLNVLMIAFDFIDKNYPSLSNWKQNIIDLLISEFIRPDKGDYSVEQRTAFFIFLSRSLLSSDTLFITNEIVHIIVDFLFSSEMKRFDERQQLLIQMLDETRLNCDENLFLQKGEASEMYQICEHILIKREDWIYLFRIYLKDSSKSQIIFDYINSFFSQDTILKDESYRKRLLNVIFENFLSLMMINDNQSIDFFFAHYANSEESFKEFISLLQADKYYLYRFLKLILYDYRLECLKTSDSNKMKMYSFCYSSHYQELLIELACQFDDGIVINILKLLNDYIDINALNICNRFNNIYGEAFLYEKIKNYNKSFEILFIDFQQSISIQIKTALTNIADHNNISAYKSSNFDHLISKFEWIIDFCNRLSSFLDEDKEKYWIQLLECLIDTKILANNISKSIDTIYLPNFGETFNDEMKKKMLNIFINELNDKLKNLFETLIHSMLTHLNLMACFDIILNRVLHHKEDVYDIREILLCILENYNYEKTLLGLTNGILLNEQYTLIDQFKLNRSKSKCNHHLYCAICLRSFIGKGNDENEHFVYNCSHIFHSACLTILHNDKHIDVDICPRCNYLIDDQRSLIDLKQKNNLIEDLKEWRTLPASSSSSSSSRKENQLLHLDNTQLRALNYFHSGRFKY